MFSSLSFNFVYDPCGMIQFFFLFLISIAAIMPHGGLFNGIPSRFTNLFQPSIFGFLWSKILFILFKIFLTEFLNIDKLFNLKLKISDINALNSFLKLKSSGFFNVTLYAMQLDGIITVRAGVAAIPGH